jgi:hypothetical protein
MDKGGTTLKLTILSRHCQVCDRGFLTIPTKRVETGARLIDLGVVSGPQDEAAKVLRIIFDIKRHRLLVTVLAFKDLVHETAGVRGAPSAFSLRQG